MHATGAMRFYQLLYELIDALGRTTEVQLGALCPVAAVWGSGGCVHIEPIGKHTPCAVPNAPSGCNALTRTPAVLARGGVLC